MLAKLKPSEPSLRDLLDDPIVKRLMQRDGVEAEKLRPYLEKLQQDIALREISH